MKPIKLHEQAISILASIEMWEGLIKNDKLYASQMKHYIQQEAYRDAKCRIDTHKKCIERFKLRYNKIVTNLHLNI